MDAIDALLGTTIVTSGTPTTGVPPIWNGSAWKVDGTQKIAISALTPGADQSVMYTSGTSPAWLPLGSNTNVLQVSGGALAWGPSPSAMKVSYVGCAVLNTAASNTFETASAAILIPFTVQATQNITTISFIAGSTQSGNYDVGVYDLAGNRKVSKGSTAQSTLTANVLNNITISTTSLPGGQYWLALAADNATGTFYSGNAVADRLFNQQCRKVTTSFPLPATITPGATAPSNNYLLTGTVT